MEGLLVTASALGGCVEQPPQFQLAQVCRLGRILSRGIFEIVILQWLVGRSCLFFQQPLDFPEIPLRE